MSASSSVTETGSVAKHQGVSISFEVSVEPFRKPASLPSCTAFGSDSRRHFGRELDPFPRLRDRLGRECRPRLLFQFVDQDFLRFVRVALHPLRQFRVRRHNFLREIAMLQKLHARDQPGREDVLVFEENFRFRFALQSRDPWFDGPDPIDTSALEECQLVGICSRQNRHVTSGLRDFESLRLQPCPAGDVLRVAELRRGDFLSAKISRRFDRSIRFHHQRGAAICRARNEHEFQSPFDLKCALRAGPWPT